MPGVGTDVLNLTRYYYTVFQSGRIRFHSRQRRWPFIPLLLIFANSSYWLLLSCTQVKTAKVIFKIRENKFMISTQVEGKKQKETHYKPTHAPMHSHTLQLCFRNHSESVDEAKTRILHGFDTCSALFPTIFSLFPSYIVFFPVSTPSTKQLSKSSPQALFLGNPV